MKKYICLIICAALVSASCSHVMDDFKKDSRGNQTPYTVEHWQQNISDDDYTLVSADTQTLTGTTGAPLAYGDSGAANTYTGFTYSAALTSINGTVSTTGTIAADGSTVVKLYYNRNIITLTFDLAGGTTSTTFTATTSTGGTLSGKYRAAVSIENPTKTGYSFSAGKPALPATFPAADASYTATYTLAGDYNITYNLAGGTNAATNPASYNLETETITLAAAAKTGYIFGGWYSDSGFTAAVTQIAKGSTGAVTLYAKWTAATDTSYTVQHWQQNITDDDYTLVSADTQNLTGTTGAPLAYGDSSAANTYAGFTYSAALTSINGTVSTTGAIAADGSTVVKLYYSRNIITLTFDLAGGTTSTTFTATTSTGGTLSGKYGAAVSIENPTKTGYSFSAWNPDLPATFPAADASYTATFNAGDYNITYNLAGGTNASTNPATYNIETETITLADATKTGYTFGGWYSDSGFTAAVTQIAKGSTGAVTLYAKWKTKNTMTLSFISGDVSVSVSGSTFTATPPDAGTYTYKWYFNGSVQSSTTP